ncbi:hypothetical protein DPMN_064710 [Dreissena polymorpha]|uniref:Uncharacterized protein n=1 Tax=Dreissena polymorpha TaxID=45954 RepID=A0A9D4CDN0_DREPO|nr:hypothetical protein DPMN_064710 [Dreissena polymorpha]
MKNDRGYYWNNKTEQGKRFCITWSVRPAVSNSIMKLFNQNDDDEDIGIFKNRADGIRSRVSSEEECIKKMMQLFGSYDIFGGHKDCSQKHLRTLQLPGNDITDNLLTCES